MTGRIDEARADGLSGYIDRLARIGAPDLPDGAILQPSTATSAGEFGLPAPSSTRPPLRIRSNTRPPAPHRLRHPRDSPGTESSRLPILGANSLFTGTSNQLGDFESGLTAAWFGAVPAVLIGGGGTIAVALLWMYLFPSLRRVRTLDG